MSIKYYNNLKTESTMQSLRGIFPKPKAPPKRDFIKENVKSLRQRKQSKCEEQQSNDRDLNRPHRKTRSISHSRSAIRSSSNSVKSTAINKSKENVTEINSVHKTRPLSVQSRDASSQTETVDDELFHKDVIIRLPSASVYNKKSESTIGTNEVKNHHQELISPLTELENDEETIDEYYKLTNDRLLVMASATNQKQTETETICQTEHTSRQTRSISTTNQLTESNATTAHREQIDQTQINQHHLISSRCANSQQLCAKDTKKPVLPSSYRVGELPKYLKEMKIKEAEKNRLDSLIDPNCPPGHTLLSEADRLESLNIAQKKYHDLIEELNHMPMTSQTLRIRNRKIEIEKELNKLDETMQIFSRNKVYVKNE